MSEADIDAGAIALYRICAIRWAPTWADVPEKTKDQFRKEARAVLETDATITTLRTELAEAKARAENDNLILTDYRRLHNALEIELEAAKARCALIDEAQDANAGLVRKLAERDETLASQSALLNQAEEALEWYRAKVADCRKVTSEGEAACNALDRDGGGKARAALAAIAANKGEGK